jgi:hypothetical protein
MPHGIGTLDVGQIGPKPKREGVLSAMDEQLRSPAGLLRWILSAIDGRHVQIQFIDARRCATIPKQVVLWKVEI